MNEMKSAFMSALALLAVSAEAKLASDGPSFSHVCRVIDEYGVPLTNAVVHGCINPGYRIGEIRFAGVDLGGGHYELKGTAMAGVSYRVTADGYYETSGKYSHGRSERELFTGERWIPYGETNTVVLKKMENPRPLVTRRFNRDIALPPGMEWVGYDCVVGDVCEPLGCGKVADFLVRESRFGDRGLYRSLAELSFTNHPYAGFYVLRQDSQSQLKSVRRADVNAAYQNRGPYADMPQDARDDDWQIVFRTRTRVDREGNLVSAHYGKIEGCVRFAGGRMSLGRVFFNPSPNDTNLEHYGSYDGERRRNLGIADFTVPEKDDFRHGRAVSNAMTVVGEGGAPIGSTASICQLINGDRGKDAYARFWAYADGYYMARGKSRVCDVSRCRDWESDATVYRWRPEGPAVVRLRPVKNPQWMISGAGPRCDRVKPNGDWCAIDLERLDWCAPFGKGREADMLVRWSETGGEAGNGRRLMMEIAFTNNPYAGFYKRPLVVGSSFDSDYLADTNASFAATSRFVSEVGGYPRGFMLDGSSYWVFRTRTKVDGEGRLVSAHYGKLYGPIRVDCRGDWLRRAVFNPIPNDANLEEIDVYRENEEALRRLKLREMR